MGCLQPRGKFSTKVTKQLEAKVGEIPGVYPGTSYIVLFDAEGDVIVQVNAVEASSEEVLRKIVSLKKSALEFAGTLNQLSCPVIHVRGHTNLFSCYEVGNYLLAFYTEMHGASMGVFEGSEANAKMERLVSELLGTIRAAHAKQKNS